MADENQVNITIKAKYEGKGNVDAKKGLQDVQKQAEKTNAVMAKGATEAQNRIVTLSSALNIVKTAWAGVSGIVGWFAESIAMASKNARSVNMLAAAYNAVGYNATGAIDKAKAFASEMQRLTGIADEAFLDGQRLLANYGIVGNKAQESIRAAYALSVGIGTSLESALMLVAKAAAGSTASLSRYGIVLGDNVKDGEKFDAVLKQINDKFGATAQAAMGDMTSQVGALKQAWGDFREEIGQRLIPTMTKLLQVGTQAVDMLGNMFLQKRDVDLMAYQKTTEKIAELNREINRLDEVKAKNGKAINEEVYQKRRDALEKERDYQRQILKDLEQDNYKRAQQAKIEDDIVEKQAEQINKSRTLATIKKEEADATKKAREEEEKRVNMVLNNAGVGPRQTTSGWDTSSYEQKPEMSLASIITGTDLNEMDNFFKNIEEQKAGLQDLYNKKLELLEQGNLDEETFAEAKHEVDRQFAEKTAALDLEVSKKRQTTMATALNNLASLQNSSNKKMAAVGKAAAIAQTTIDTYKSATAAYSAMAGIPVVGPALAVAAAAAAIAAGLNNVSQIAGVQLAEGGLIKAVTGGVPAVVGEGGSDEAVLPLDNAQAMARIGGAIAEQGSGFGGVNLTQNITIQAGESLIPEITNALRNATVDALEMANLTVKVGNSQQGYSV